MKKFLIPAAAAALALVGASAAMAQPYGYYGRSYDNYSYGYARDAYRPVYGNAYSYGGRDSDRDGIPDRAEWNRDRDHDGRPDQWDRYDNRRDRHHHRHHRYDDRYSYRSGYDYYRY